VDKEFTPATEQALGGAILILEGNGEEVKGVGYKIVGSLGEHHN